MIEPASVAMEDPSRVGEARRLAATMAGRLGFDEAGAGRAALVVTEAATNLVKHGGGGELLLAPIERAGVAGLEILALDKGPGMADVDRCLADGYSTAGSPGNGLGAMARLAADFDVYSAPGLGTALLARLWASPVTAGSRPGGLDVGAVSLAKAGEPASGDAWATAGPDGRPSLLVVDGLGHGPLAAQAAREAVRVFGESAGLGPIEALKLIHAALRPTRGAVAAIAEVDPAARSIRYVGVGNIAASVIVDGTSRSLVSMNGTLGHEVRRFQEFAYAWPSGAVLVMQSDGLATSWKLDRYPGLPARDPSLVAGVLYRDFARGRDDATALVARDMQARGAR
jgi:anti-sigma regulatory factor (Ser/Thr protein kinase)